MIINMQLETPSNKKYLYKKDDLVVLDLPDQEHSFTLAIVTSNLRKTKQKVKLKLLSRLYN